MSNGVDLAAWGAKVLGAKSAPPPASPAPSPEPPPAAATGAAADLRGFNKTIDDLKKSLAAETDRAAQLRIASQMQVVVGELQGKLAAQTNPKVQQVLSALIDKAEAAVAAAASSPAAPPTAPSATAARLATKEKGTEYVGEERERGWRAGDNAAAARSNRLVTDYHEDPAKSKAKIEGGQLKDAADKPMTGTFGYVIDPSDASLHTFDPHAVWIVKIADPSNRRPYKGDWPPPQSFWLSVGADEQVRTTHHTSPLAGGAVAGAGEVTAVSGKITNVSNRSGHYKPNATLMIQTVEELLKQGAFLDDQYMMDNPDPSQKEGVPLSGPALELFNKTKLVQDAVQGGIASAQPLLQSFRDRIADLKGQADRTPDQDAELEATEKRLTEIKAAIDRDLATIAEGKRLLAQLGAAPSKKVKGNVDFIDGAAAKTGLGFVTTEAASSNPIEFLASGAGATAAGPETGKVEKVADLKAAALRELRAGQKTRREELDKQALERLQKTLDGYKAQLGSLAGKETTPEYKALQRQIDALEASFRQAPPTQEEVDKALAALDALAVRCGIDTTPPAPPTVATSAPASPPELADWVLGVNYCHSNQQIADALGITLTALQTIEAPTSGLAAPTVASQLGKPVEEVAAIFHRLESARSATPPPTEPTAPPPVVDGWDNGRRECSPTAEIADALGIALSELQALADDDNAINAPGVAHRLGKPVAEVAEIMRRFEI